MHDDLTPASATSSGNFVRRMRALGPQWFEFAKLVSIYNACFTSIVMAPILLASYSDRLHVVSSSVGLVLSVENFAYAGGLLLLTNYFRRFSGKLVMAVSLSVMMLMSLLTALVADLATMMILRACFGLAEGVCTSVVVARFSQYENAQRTWSMAYFVNLLYAFAILLVGGAVKAWWGLSGVVILMALIYFACVGCALALKPSVEGAESVTVEPNGASRFPLFPALCGAAALFLVNASHTILWAFQGRLGERTDLAPSTISFFLAVSLWGAFFGAVAILLIGERFGRRWPNAFAYVILITAAYLLSIPNAVPYVAGATLAKAGWFFGLPIITGALSALDRSGRAATIGVAMMTLGASFGPAMAAFFARGGLPMVCLLSGGLYLASFIATQPLLWSAGSVRENAPGIKTRRAGGAI